MVPGCDGGLHVELTVNVCTGPEPHALLAVTETSPPLAPAVTLIEVVVELPLHPLGIAQVYDVAPETETML